MYGRAQLVEEDLQASRRSLAEREQLLRATLESTGDGFVVLAPDGTATLCNAQFRNMFGMRSAQRWVRRETSTTESLLARARAKRRRPRLTCRRGGKRQARKLKRSE